MGYRIGIDVGGTFVDFLLVDGEGGIDTFKELSTPSDPAEGLINGLTRIAKSKQLTLQDFVSRVDIIVHGTTVTTNTVLMGSGAKTGALATNGFRDLLRLGIGTRPTSELYNPKYPQAPPLIPSYLVQVVEGRIDSNGEEIVPLNEEDIRRGTGYLKEHGVEAIGISFMFSFLNHSHEDRACEIVEEEIPGVYVSKSSDILPKLGLYRRMSTVALNCLVGPVLKRYLLSLVNRLQEANFKGTLLIMQSNGGVMSADLTSKFAVNTLLSGPAAGPVAGMFYGNIHNLRNILTVDMGGTSFDVCLISDNQFDITTESKVGRYDIAVPMVDVHTIGAGGGSIAWIDDSGLLQVGPQSAGADPGPACYGKGGKLPTVTDADLILGYLNPDYFFGGEIRLDAKAAETAMQDIADRLKIPVLDVANGIYSLVNTKMAAGVRLVSIARGYDPREFALVVAGGSGPIHATSIARELEIPLIIIPRESAVLCASGMLMSNLRHDFVRNYGRRLLKEEMQIARLNELCHQMAVEGITTLEREGIPKHSMKLAFSADVRYEGQHREIEVPLPMSGSSSTFITDDIVKLIDSYNSRHDALYGYAMPDAVCELVNLRLTTEGITEKPDFRESKLAGTDVSEALKGRRRVFFETEFISTPVYNGLKMGYGNVVSGPVIIEEPSTTIVVTPDYDLVCDRFSNYILYPKGIVPEIIMEDIRKEIR